MSLVINPYAYAAGSGADPSYSSVVALLHFNGSDTSTTMADQKGHTFTAFGNAQLDTAQSKFGVSSLMLDGTGDYITTPDSVDFQVGSGDFTIECWVRLSSTTVRHGIFCKGQVGGARQCFDLSTQPDGSVVLYISDATSYFVVLSSSASAFAANTWFHVAVVRNGTAFTFYINGVNQTSITSSATVLNLAQPLNIGRSNEWGVTADGWIDEFRFTKGVARYTANFTPPAAPFSDS